MRRPVRLWRLLAFACLGTALGWRVSHTRTVEAGPRSPRAVTQADRPLQGQAPALTLRPAPTTPVRIEINPSVDEPGADGEAAKKCGIPSEAGNEPWSRWVNLSGRRVQAKSSSDSVPVYAVRTPSGVIVLVANHGERDTPIRVEVRGGRGIYAVERHSFALEENGKASRTELLQSVVLGGPGTVAKQVRLKGGTAMVVCVQDECRELGVALRNARAALWALADRKPRAFRLIREPFGEAAPRISDVVNQGGAAPRARVATRAERAALSLAHAQTLFGNLRSSGAVGADAAESVGEALDRLEAGLSTVSAALLDLVPNCQWEDEDPANPGRVPLSVQLSNYGARSLRMVKIGIVAPEECRISPDDPAVFRAVRPGETVKATFMVQTASAHDLSAVRANLSYIAYRAPTHLQLKTL